MHDSEETVEGNWSSDCSNSDDEEQTVNTATPVSEISDLALLHF